MGEYSAGSVRKWRGKWQGVLSRRQDGKRKNVYKTFDIPSEESSNRGKPAALKALAEWRAELIAQDAQELARAALPPARETQVYDYCMAYVDARVSRNEIDPSTTRDYRHMLKRLHGGAHPIAAVKTGELKRADVERWITGLTEQGLAPATVKKALRVLRQCMRYAVELEDLDKDPTLGVKPPKATAKDPNALDAAGRARLMDILKPMGHAPLAVAVLLAMQGSLREGECCGLRWKNADIEAGVVRVRESIGEGEGGTYVKEPKTTASRRDVPMTPQLKALLTMRRAEAITQCMAAGVPFSGDLYVLGDISGDYMNPNYLGKQWIALAKAYGITGTQGKRVTFHDLRHTFATAAVAEGIDVKTVSSLMGHSNAAMTLNIYASADPDARARAIEQLGQAFDRPAPKGEVIEFRVAAGE